MISYLELVKFGSYSLSLISSLPIFAYEIRTKIKEKNLTLILVDFELALEGDDFALRLLTDSNKSLKEAVFNRGSFLILINFRLLILLCCFEIKLLLMIYSLKPRAFDLTRVRLDPVAFTVATSLEKLLFCPASVELIGD